MDSNIPYVASYESTKYGMIATLVVVLYDYALTFDTEVEFVWTRRWSFGKALFLFNRYFGIFSLISLTIVWALQYPLSFEFCWRFGHWEAVLETIAISNAEIILILRIHAVYNRHRGLLLVLIVLLLAEILNSLVIAIRGISNTYPVSTSESDTRQSEKLENMTGLLGCQYRSLPHDYFFIWIPPLILETILMSLMMYEGWKIYKSKTGSKLLHLIIRDSLYYFLVMILALLANSIVWALPAELHVPYGIAIGWTVAIPCAAGSRLLLNIRERYFKERTIVLSISSGEYYQGMQEMQL